MQPSVAAPKAHYEEIELRAVGDDIAGSTAWAVYDVSLSGCRLRGKLRPGLAVVPGTCQSRPHNYRLALQECVGQTDDYVWSTVHASKSPRAAQS